MKKIFLSLVLATSLFSEDVFFGQNMFNGSFSSSKQLQSNDSYILKPNDIVSVKIWGGFDYESDLTIDSQGNIFVPRLGILSLAGKKKSEIGNLLTSLVKKQFSNSVYSYIDIKQFQPISVYVSGFVKNPGLYNGNSSDSILQYIDSAKGIANGGSYRNISLLRNGVLVQEFDLYDFMLKGSLPNVSLQAGDSIFVKPLNSYVSVDGECSSPISFETKGETSLEELSLACGAKNNINLAMVETFDKENKSFEIKPLEKVSIPNKAKVTLLSELKTNQLKISLKNENNQKTLFLSKGSDFESFLKENNLSVSDVKLFRKSVAKRQKDLLLKSLQDLETTTLTKSSRTVEEATIRKQEAQAIIDFVDRAKKVEPLGQVVLTSSKISLEDGDLIEVITKNQPIVIQGEVLFPTAQAYNDSFSLERYVELSGGLTDKADDSKILVLRQNGEVTLFSSGYFDKSPKINSGDSIIVLSKVDEKYFQSAKDITQILYQIAVGAAVVLKAF